MRVYSSRIAKPLIAITLLLIGPAWAEDAINMDLSRLVADDQAARQNTAEIVWGTLKVEDAKRRALVLEMLRSGRIKAPIDYENAALIFQHGTDSDDYRLAYSLASVAVALEPSRHLAAWLQKAAWDRLMISLGKEQWYGTQSSADNAATKG